MRVRKIQIAQAKAGMKVAEDVYTDNNELMIPGETILTEEVIARLKQFGIYRLEVYGADSGETVTDLPQIEIPETTYVTQVRKTAEFQQFQRTFEESMGQVKKTFGKILAEDSQINTDMLLAEVDLILKKGRNGLHVLEMMNCMREYDDVTFAHCISVSMLCHVIGEWLGYKEAELRTLTLSGLLHDVGKLMVSPELIAKPGKLTEQEYLAVKEHAMYGYNILRNQVIDQRIKYAALMHHERCDGTGYPGANNMKQIDNFAKIVAIADVYDAMTADRPYRKGMCPFRVLEMFEEEGLEKYDPKVLLTFMQKTVEAYINVDVELNNHQIGEIISTNPFSISKPLVRVGDNFIDLSKNKELRIEKIL